MRLARAVTAGSFLVLGGSTELLAREAIGKEGLGATAAIALTSEGESCYVLYCSSQSADSQVHRVRSCPAVSPLGVVRT